MSDNKSTLGVLGGGQLGLMFTQAAHAMGYRVIVLEPDPDSPAGALADEHIELPYDDQDGLRQLGVECAVVTVEFENVPAPSIDYLKKFCPVFPSSECFRLTQNRVVEKTMILDQGLSTAEFVVIRSQKDLEDARTSMKFPAILKITELGYDGKGQAVVMVPDDLDAAYEYLDKAECILEEKIDLAKEISVVLGRSQHGEIVCFPIAENLHKKGVLHISSVPADIDDEMREQAEAAATTLANGLDFVGIMAVEFFITKKGHLLVNEIAPRTHNSGHYTQDATVTSQFEQQVRIITDQELGSTKLKSPVVMVNLLGNLWKKRVPNWDMLEVDRNIHLHLYNKAEARRGRKMGHFNYLGSDVAKIQEKALAMFAKLGGSVD